MKRVSSAHNSLSSIVVLTNRQHLSFEIEMAAVLAEEKNIMKEVLF